MQLQRPSALPLPATLPEGLATCAARLGQRPAVTVLTAAGRAEQGFSSLAQWAAKGAHLLEVDHELGPDDHVLVDVPPGWMLAAVCAAVWWTGATVVTELADRAVVCVVHESRPLPDHDEVYVVGDAVDGGVTVPVTAREWVAEVQAFPDRPPVPRARPDTMALVTSGERLTHADVIARLHGAAGVRGLDLAAHPGNGIVDVAARPVVTGHATVVLTDGLSPQAAAGDRVASWA